MRAAWAEVQTFLPSLSTPCLKAPDTQAAVAGGRPPQFSGALARPSTWRICAGTLCLHALTGCRPVRPRRQGGHPAPERPALLAYSPPACADALPVRRPACLPAASPCRRAVTAVPPPPRAHRQRPPPACRAARRLSSRRRRLTPTFAVCREQALHARVTAGAHDTVSGASSWVVATSRRRKCAVQCACLSACSLAGLGWRIATVNKLGIGAPDSRR